MKMEERLLTVVIHLDQHHVSTETTEEDKSTSAVQ